MLVQQGAALRHLHNRVDSVGHPRLLGGCAAARRRAAHLDGAQLLLPTAGHRLREQEQESQDERVSLCQRVPGEAVVGQHNGRGERVLAGRLFEVQAVIRWLRWPAAPATGLRPAAGAPHE